MEISQPQNKSSYNPLVREKRCEENICSTPQNFVFWSTLEFTQEQFVTGGEPEQELVESPKFYLHRAALTNDLWDAAEELIPKHKEKNFCILYLPLGTGQQKMCADCFFMESISHRG